MSGLSEAGFDDILENDLIILVTLGRRMSLQVAADLMLDLGIVQQAIGEACDRLVGQGYVEVKSDPNAPRRTMLGVTRRGHAAGRVILGTANSRRWTDLIRQGDIIISSVPKSGTTWMQMICALLIFQTTDLPAPLSELSPDPDGIFSLRSTVVARLAAQQHRRFIKAHADLSKIPANPLVTYVTVARHPLDSAVSLYYHYQMLLGKKADQGKGTEPRNGRQSQPHEALLSWMEPRNGPVAIGDGYSLPQVMQHLSAAWARRHEPNVVLVRYEDLCTDLEGQMRLLAVRPGITVPEGLWPRLVEAATFEQMRAAASRLQPLADLANPKSFFRSGQSGTGRELLTGAELARYRELAARLAPADLLDWLHRPGAPAAKTG